MQWVAAKTYLPLPRCVLHARGPSGYAGPRDEAALRETYARCWQSAALRELPCLAAPALGCGVAGFPPAVSARAALDALEQATELPAWIEFVLLDEDVYASFADAAHARWGRS